MESISLANKILTLSYLEFRVKNQKFGQLVLYCR